MSIFLRALVYFRRSDESWSINQHAGGDPATRRLAGVDLECGVGRKRLGHRARLRSARGHPVDGNDPPGADGDQVQGDERVAHDEVARFGIAPHEEHPSVGCQHRPIHQAAGTLGVVVGDLRCEAHDSARGVETHRDAGSRARARDEPAEQHQPNATHALSVRPPPAMTMGNVNTTGRDGSFRNGPLGDGSSLVCDSEQAPRPAGAKSEGQLPEEATLDLRFGRRRVSALVICLLLATSAARGSEPANSTPEAAKVEPGLLGAATTTRVIARFGTAVPSLPSGVKALYTFASVPAVYAAATPAALRALASLPSLAYLERDKPIAFDLDTATTASRAKSVWGPPSPQEPVTVGGRVVDGTGIGIAIVDTGLDGTHPDFQVPGKVRGNYIVSPAGVHDAPASYSDEASPHGTHVAGIAAGNGGASGGEFRGTAPGASLYSFAMGVSTLSMPSIAFDWILQHGASQDPPIRVLNNSWHCARDTICNRMNPDSIHIVLASKLAESGVTITWSAGNDGGDGTVANTNRESINPTPGIISVANYDDGDRGSRSNCVSSSSSRGAAVLPSTWPDIAAPGRNITSTWALGASTSPPQDLPNSRRPDGKNMYRQAGGTSMAAPHVAGIAALMLQAAPSLTPADIEYILKATASKPVCTMRGFKPSPDAAKPIDRDPAPFVRADPAHPFDGSRFFDGHGLIDAYAAVQAAMTFNGIPPKPALEPLPAVYEQIRIGVQRDRSFAIRGTDALSEQAPTDPAGARIALGDEPLSFTSPAIPGLETDGVEVGVWLGTDAEYYATYLGRPTTVHSTVTGLRVTVEQVGENDTVVLADTEALLRLAAPGAPIFRRWVFPLPEPVRFDAGDRLRLTLELRSDVPDADEAKLAWILYADSSATPSGIDVGHQVTPVPSGSALECQARIDCAQVGAERSLTSFECNADAVFPDHPELRVRWYGPAGSSAGARCQGNLALCTVPGEPAKDPWGSCETSVPLLIAADTYDTTCFTITADGARAEGLGFCDQFPPSQEAQN